MRALTLDKNGAFCFKFVDTNTMEGCKLLIKGVLENVKYQNIYNMDEGIDLSFYKNNKENVKDDDFLINYIQSSIHEELKKLFFVANVVFKNTTINNNVLNIKFDVYIVLQDKIEKIDFEYNIV